MAVVLISWLKLAENMKKTNRKAYKVLRSGLSMILTLVLLIHAGRPLQAQADSLNEEAGLPIEQPTAEEQAPKAPQTVQEALLEVCTGRGYGEDCAKNLLGMLWKESNNVATAVGDRGKARGYFQIHYKLHKITIACAEDLKCSADWTIDYLERNHYPKHVKYAIQCHNGCNIDNGYAASALRHGRRLWNQPLPIVNPALALE